MDVDFKITSRDFQNICRICLVGGDLKPLLETDLVKIFSVISEIEFSENDPLPKNLCISCSNYLLDITRFAEKCKANNAILALVLETEEKEHKLKSLDFDLNLDNGYRDFDPDEDDSFYDNENDLKSESEYGDPTYELKHENVLDDDEEKPVKKKRGRKRKNLLADPKPIKLRGKKRGRKPKIILSDDEEEKSDSKIPVCKACGTTFTSKTKLCSHYKENESCRPRNFRLFKCDICEKEFSTIRRRNEHMNIHTGETPYICTYCGKGFQLYPAHFKHVYRHRLALGEVELKPGYMETRVRLNLKCELCPKVFASRSGFANHKLIHQGVKIQYKKRPKKEEEGPKLKNFLCNYCAKSFRTKVQLDGHIRGHTGERPFSCAYCHKFFKTKAALKTHEMNHLGTTPQRFKCETCNKPFSLKAHYEVHKRTHTGEKPFECHFCGKCFNYRGTWRAATDDMASLGQRFNKRWRRLVMSSVAAFRHLIKGKPVTYSDIFIYRIHIRMHTGETPYACPICGNRYHDKSSLNKHQKKKGHLGEAVVQEKLLL